MALMKKIIVCFLAFILIATRLYPPLTSILAGEDLLTGRLLSLGASFDQVIDPSTDTLLFQTKELSLYLNKESLAIKVVDLKTDYVWSSDRDVSEDTRVNALWTNRIMSGVTLEYFDVKTKKAAYATITGNECDIDFKQGDNKVQIDVNFTALSISFTLYLLLSDNTLTVELPGSSMIESGQYVVKSISLFPFLGSSSYEDTDGYILAPEGSGAILEYNQHKTTIKGPYKAKLYGVDVGLNDSEINAYSLTMPMYGIVNGVNKAALYTHITSGSAYAELNIYPSGVTTNYNWACFIYYYRQSYFQPTASDGTGYTDIELKINRFDISVSYKFLHDEDASYSGIARDYQRMLVSDGVLTKNTSETSFINIEFLGAEIYKTMLGFKTNVYTSVSDVISIVEDLKDSGMNPTITYSGTSKNGISGNQPNKFPLEKKLGSNTDFKDLIKDFSNKNIPLYFIMDYTYARTDRSGFNRKKDIIRKVDSKLYIFEEEYNNYSLTKGVLSLKKARSMFLDDLEQYEKFGMNIAIQNTGSLLYSDYGTANLNREEAKNAAEGLFADSTVKTAFYTPNEYMWKSMDKYFMIPISSSGFLHFTKDVPFLQMVLKGYVDYFASWHNISANPKEEVLRLIEYGAYPSFIITKESPFELSNTPSRYIYSSEYGLWKTKIKDIEATIKSALQGVANAHIVNHEYKDEIAIVQYDNGVTIYVNYSENSKTIGSIVIEPGSFYVSEVR